MPYTLAVDREDYENPLADIENLGIPTKGDLEYLVCSLMDIYMADGRKFKYSDLHACAYAVQHSAHEFIRRFLDQREDIAKDKNGDVFNRMNRIWALED